MKRAEELGAIAPGKRIGTHTLRHSYARHLLMNGIPINYLSSWLGHTSIQTMLILPGACAGPDEESGVGAVTCLPSSLELAQMQRWPQEVKPEAEQGIHPLLFFP